MIFLSEQIVLSDVPLSKTDPAHTALQRALVHLVPDCGVVQEPSGDNTLPPEIGFSDDCTHSIRTGREEAERFIDEYMAGIARNKS